MSRQSNGVYIFLLLARSSANVITLKLKKEVVSSAYDCQGGITSHLSESDSD